MKKKLKRNTDDGMVAGVCAGLAEHFNIDPVWIRLLWAIAIFGFGVGLLVYVIMWIVMPEKK